MSITQLWRGTGRRRLPDALEAARLREITLNACIDDLTAERDQLLAQRDAIRVAATHLGRDLDEEMRAHAATRKAFAAAEQAHAAQTAALRDELRLSREAQQRANAEVARHRADWQAWAEAQRRLEMTNRRLEREVKGAQDTQALDVSGLRAEHAAGEGNGVAGVRNAPEAPAVVVPVGLDADDTVTLPRAALPPKVEVHPVGQVKPIPAPAVTEPTVPVTTLAAAHGGAA